MNAIDANALLSSLNHAIEIMERNRTPDPVVIAACDVLKQARARAVQALDRLRGQPPSAIHRPIAA